MRFRHCLPALCFVLSGCGAIYSTSSSPDWVMPQPATREQKQRIIAGEPATSVLSGDRVGVSGTLDWSKLWDR